MHASLVEKDSREDVLLIKDTRSKEDMHLFKDNRTKATTGSSVSSLYPLKDFEDSGTESGFFVFPDLSVRMEGTYRLKFCLYEMVGNDVHFCSYVISDPLVVYSAKKFPGMEESTQLSQYFAEQGLKIRIRKEVRPKKRSRGECIAAPSSQSPTGSQHQDVGETVESQDDEDQAMTKDMPSASKRRVSGSRNTESRRDDHPSAPQKIAVQLDDSETRSNQIGKSSGAWRGQGPEHLEYQAMPNVVDRPGLAPQPYPQHHSYFRDNTTVTRRVSTTNRATEGVSHMDLNVTSSYGSGVHPEQRIDGGRIRPQDQTSTNIDRSIASTPSSRQDSIIPYRSAGLPKQTAALPVTSLEGQHLDQRSSDMDHDPSRPFENGAMPGPSHLLRHNISPSTGYHEETRRKSSTEMRRESGTDPSFINESRGVTDSQWHQSEHLPNSHSVGENSRNSQAQSFARISTIESPYTTYPSRQGYAGATVQRPSDHATSSSYVEDHHRGPAVPTTYERSDHLSRPQQDTLPQHKPPFHSVSQYPQHSPHLSRDPQYIDNQAYPPQGQPTSRPRPASHHDSYSEFQHQTAPYPHSLSHGKYPATDAPISSYNSQGMDTSQPVRYPPGYMGEAVASQGRYPAHSHSSHLNSATVSAGHGHRDDPETSRRVSLTSSPPRPSDHRSQSMAHFTHAVPTPVKMFGHEHGDTIPSGGYTTFHRDRESDIAPLPRQLVHPSSGHPTYQDSGSQSMAGSGIASHHLRGNPSSGSYLNRPLEPAVGLGKGPPPRPASTEYDLEGHQPYGPGRPIPLSSNSRPPHTIISVAATAAPPSGPLVRQSIPPGGVAGPGQSRGLGHYDERGDVQGRHYTTTHPMPHDNDLGPYGGYTMVSAQGGGGVGSRSHEHGYKHPNVGPPLPSSGLSGHGVPGSHIYGSSYSSQTSSGPSSHPHAHQHQQQFQAHGHHQFQQYSGALSQGHISQAAQHVHSHGHGYEEQQHVVHGHLYPQQ
ncbi:hypothetical protein BGX27_004572 [Mortierella sp. AM989]|nr:hypothetical protein BGX27_004572 [Mortierella sp. AM989]